VDFVMSAECKAMVVGLSATPFSPGLGRIFTNLVNAATMASLTDSGVLVPMRVFSCRRPDMSGAETSGGEWTDRAAEERELVLVGDVVSEWNRLARGLKTIVFGATINHCAEIARQFNEAGVPAAMFTCETQEDERKALLDDYRKPDSYIRVLVSVEALAKGFDVPDVGCVCDCRPLRKSLSTAIQMWGRGLRSSPETGKTECLLLDFSGNIIRFADDYSQIFFNGLDKLDDGEKLDKAVRRDEDKEPKACPKCGYTPMGKRCVQCGYEPAPQSLVQHLPGEMQEITLNGKKLAPDAAHLWAQLATYARTHSAPEKQQGRAAHLYREMTGGWPPREFKVESAPVVEPTRNVIGKIKSLQIAFHNRRAS
jgi:superfamily II DNA or RNA helicase